MHNTIEQNTYGLLVMEMCFAAFSCQCVASAGLAVIGGRESFGTHQENRGSEPLRLLKH